MAASAETKAQKKGPATLEVRFDAEKPHIGLADIITATLTIDGDKDLYVKLPRGWPGTSPWILVEPSATSRKATGPGHFQTRQTYLLAPRQPGDLPFVFPDVETRQGDQDPRVITFDPIVFTVTASVSPERESMRDITGIEEVAAPTIRPRSRWLAWVALALLPMMGLMLLWLRHNLRRRAPRSPIERALYEWQRLVDMRLPEHGRGERFMTLLTLLVRDVLERACRVPARRQTTEEFLRAISPDNPLGAADHDFLAEFLRRGDAVKYANVEISAEECATWADRTRQFLQRLRDTPITKPG